MVLSPPPPPYTHFHMCFSCLFWRMRRSRPHALSRAADHLSKYCIRVSVTVWRRGLGSYTQSIQQPHTHIHTASPIPHPDLFPTQSSCHFSIGMPCRDWFYCSIWKSMFNDQIACNFGYVQQSSLDWSNGELLWTLLVKKNTDTSTQIELNRLNLHETFSYMLLPGEVCNNFLLLECNYGWIWFLFRSHLLPERW